MVIIGHGIDIYELERVRQHLARSDNDWLEAVFTHAERAAADPSPNDVAYYAGRYAAKEAVAKALGTGFSGDVTWLDIEILRRSTGSPEVCLAAGAACVASTIGITGWYLSISHVNDLAVASAIATGPG